MLGFLPDFKLRFMALRTSLRALEIGSCPDGPGERQNTAHKHENGEDQREFARTIHGFCC